MDKYKEIKCDICGSDVDVTPISKLGVDGKMTVEYKCRRKNCPRHFHSTTKVIMD